MQVGDIVVFRNGAVPGIIIAEKGDSSDQWGYLLGIIWMDDSSTVRWYPRGPEYLRVISEGNNGNER